jgi:hypothetical protein
MTASPLLHLKFDEISGAFAKDSSGNNNHGTIVGAATWVNGKKGKALSLNGSTNAVVLGDILDIGTSDQTFTCWIKTSSTNVRIIDKSDWTSIWRGIMIWLDGSGYFYAALGDGTTYVNQASSILNDGNWHHIAVVFDRDGLLQIFIDGIAKQTISIACMVASNIRRA